MESMQSLTPPKLLQGWTEGVLVIVQAAEVRTGSCDECNLNEKCNKAKKKKKKKM